MSTPASRARPEHGARDLPQSAARARLHDPDVDSGVHLPVPAHRAAGFRHSGARIRARCHCVELKSLKLYIWSFRDRGAFHEAVTNEILDHLVGAVAPRFMRLTARFNVRGGIYTSVIAEHRKPGWQPAPQVTPP